MRRNGEQDSRLQLATLLPGKPDGVHHALLLAVLLDIHGLQVVLGNDLESIVTAKIHQYLRWKLTFSKRFPNLISSMFTYFSNRRRMRECMLMVEYEYDWRFISSDARRRSLHTCLECHDEPKESLLDFQVDIGIVLISENILHRFAQPADEGVPEVLDFPF